MYVEIIYHTAQQTQVFVSRFTEGEVFRSGCCYHRGAGKVFYFRPGHETLPTYHNKEVQRVIANGVRWAAPTSPSRRPGSTRTVTPGPAATLPGPAAPSCGGADACTRVGRTTAPFTYRPSPSSSTTLARPPPLACYRTRGVRWTAWAPPSGRR